MDHRAAIYSVHVHRRGKPRERLKLGALDDQGTLVSVATAAVFVVATVVGGTALVIVSAIGLGLAVHLGLVLLMVIARVFALTEERLENIRTGHDERRITPLPTRRTGT